MNDLKSTSDKLPTLIPAVGVQIEVRLVIDDGMAFSEIDDVLDKCRELGSAEIVKVIQFTGEK